MVVAQLLEPPCPRVGHLDADASEQGLHVGRIAQVEPLLDRDVAEHALVTISGERQRLGRVDRPRTDELGDQRFGDGEIDRQPVVFEFGAQRLGGRLGVDRPDDRAVVGSPIARTSSCWRRKHSAASRA